MVKQKITIFDFDQTLTGTHTFSTHTLENTSNPFDDTQMAIGAADAKQNIKKGVEEFFKHDENHLSMIATYHNNPSFIAGFISAIFKKKLTYIETLDAGVSGTAIDRYGVDGVETSFFISYITGGGASFTSTMERLYQHGKNDQIESLRRILLDEGLIEGNTLIHYYDDTSNNFVHAKQLKQLNCYLVDRNNPIFTVLETHCSDMLGDLSKPQPVFSSDKTPLVSENREVNKVIHHNKATLNAALDRLRRLHLTKNIDPVKPHLEKFIHLVEDAMDHKNTDLLHNVVDKTYHLLQDSNASLNDYRATAMIMHGHTNKKLQALGASMLAIGLIIAIVMIAMVSAGVLPVLVLPPIMVLSTTHAVFGGYSLFAGREQGLCKEMNNIAEKEATRRVLH